VDWRRDFHTMQTVDQLPATVSPPVMKAGMTEEERRKVYQEYSERQAVFWRSPEGRAQQRLQRNYALLFETNGTFHVDNVEPGRYFIYVSLTNPNRPENYYEHIGSMNKEVTVPPAPTGKPDEAFDVGSMEVQVRGIQRAGRRAPKFELTTFDGKTVKLEDFAGKFVLLDFWATWAGTRNLDLQMLKAVYDAYNKDARLVMLGVNLDNDRKVAEAAITQNGIKWPQAYAGAWGETRLPASFGIDGLPATVLIDPEGKIAAPNLRGSAIRSTVRNRLTAAPRVRAAP
jgi:peroxiredoxin